MPRSPRPSRGPQAKGPQGEEFLLLDDWADYYDAQPQDLAFECMVGSADAQSGVTISTDRILLVPDTGDDPVVLELAEIESWVIRPYADAVDAVEVEVAGRDRLRAWLPAAFAGMVAVALTEALGPPRAA